MTLLARKIQERKLGRMASVNRDDDEDALVGLSDTECELSTFDNTNSAHQAEHEKRTSTRDILLRKLEEALSNPLHRRLLNMYTNTTTNSAKESMEHELAHILLEVIDRAD